MFVDSHAHLTFPTLETPLDELLERAQKAGLTKIINICTQPEELRMGFELSKAYPWVYQVGATTPHDVEEDGERCFDFFAEHAHRLVAIGETGLDYYYDHSPRELQKEFLRRYLKLARKHALPVVIHCREAFSDFFKILDEEFQAGGKHLPGVLHCFTGTVDEAKEVVERGWYLSLSGIVTFKKSEELRDVAKLVPKHQLLIETDTPYLAPMPYRGKTNEPAYIVETAKCIAQCRGESVEELAQTTTQNALELFRLSD
jgi:TatD DNase family protein